MSSFELHHGDCLDVLPTLAESSVDAVVTDPPYGLGFMGKSWDHGVPGIPYWQAVLAATKPGGHLLAFGGTRTFHRLACAIEDAGWELRDTLMWVYGSGFPKSLDVSKAIDKAAGAERQVIGKRTDRAASPISNIRGGKMHAGGSVAGAYDGSNITAPATEAARQWEGWGTALKPAWEPIILARKPFHGTVAQNVQALGTGALNVDGCRIEAEQRPPVTGFHNGSLLNRRAQANDRPWMLKSDPSESGATQPHPLGRWPANLVHDGSAEVVALFPETGISSGGHTPARSSAVCYGGWDTGRLSTNSGGLGDSGSAARFFYCAKASQEDRDEGCEALDRRTNNHPTVKPTDLMRWLCRLVTPPGGLILDPFMGSGSTGKAAMLEGFRFLGIDLDADHVAIARARLDFVTRQATLF